MLSSTDKFCVMRADLRVCRRTRHFFCFLALICFVIVVYELYWKDWTATFLFSSKCEECSVIMNPCGFIIWIEMRINLNEKLLTNLSIYESHVSCLNFVRDT